MNERDAGGMAGKGRFVVITSVVHHVRRDGTVVASAPYVNDVDLWAGRFGKLSVIAPRGGDVPNEKEKPYQHPSVRFFWTRGRAGPSLLPKLRFLLKVPRMVRLMLTAVAGADCVQIRLPGDIGLVGLMAIFRSITPKVVKYSNEWAPSPVDTAAIRFQKWWLRQRWGLRNGVVTVYGVERGKTGKIVRIANACYWESDIERIGKIPSERPNWNEGGVRSCFVGRLTKNKGVDIGVRAMDLLKRRGIAVSLEIVGDGTEREHLESLARAIGVENQVVFHGRLGAEGVIKVLKRSHFILLLSETEGWARVVLEGMTAGVVPVVTPVRILVELVGRGERGLVVERSAEAVADAIEGVMRDVAAYHRLVRNGTEWAREYSMEAMDRKIEEILLSLNILDHRAGPAHGSR